MNNHLPILVTSLAIVAGIARADVVLAPESEHDLGRGILKTLQDLGHAPADTVLGDPGEVPARPSNFDARSEADLLIFAYQAVAVGPATTLEPGTRLIFAAQADPTPFSVLVSDLRRGSGAGSAAATFFGPATHLWQTPDQAPHPAFGDEYLLAPPSIQLQPDAPGHAPRLPADFQVTTFGLALPAASFGLPWTLR